MNTSKLAPILLFVYNRLWHTQQTIKALQQNELAQESELYVYSDGPKNRKVAKAVAEVRNYLKHVDGFKAVHVVIRNENWGLAKSIISGVTEIVSLYNSIIVLEDDLLLSPHFLRFMNDGLNFYEKKLQVISIHGYVYPVKGRLPDTFFLKGADCWGWATWKRGWDLFEEDGQKLLEELEEKRLTAVFDFDGCFPYTKMLRDQIKGKKDSWAIRWHVSAFLNNMLTLYPGKSLVRNIGVDGTGAHCSKSDSFGNLLCMEPVHVKNIPVEESLQARRMISDYFKRSRPSFLKKAFRKLF